MNQSISGGEHHAKNISGREHHAKNTSVNSPQRPEGAKTPFNFKLRAETYFVY